MSHPTERVEPGGARAAVSTLFVTNGFVVASWVSHIPTVKSQHQVGDAQLGVVLLSMAAGAVMALLLAGWLVARFGSRRIAATAAVGLSAMLPTVLAPNIELVAVSLAIFGAFNGILDVSMNAQAVEVERRGRRPIMSSFHALFSVGGLAGAAVAGLALGRDIPPITHVLVISVIAVAATVWALPSLVSTSVIPVSPGPILIRPSRNLALLGLLAFCGLLAEGAMGDWTAVYLTDALTASPTVGATGFAAFSLAMAVGRFAGDTLIRRLGPVSVLRASGALAAVGLASGLVIHDAVVATVGFGLVGFGVSNVIPIVFGAAGRMGERTAGPALATVATLGYAGYLVGPPLIGAVAGLIGLPWALGLVCGACALIAVAPAPMPASHFGISSDPALANAPER